MTSPTCPCWDEELGQTLKGKHILGLTNISFEKDRIYSACQAEKQVGAKHPVKNVVIT
jgi:hypothetical protein